MGLRYNGTGEVMARELVIANSASEYDGRCHVALTDGARAVKSGR